MSDYATAAFAVTRVLAHEIQRNALVRDMVTRVQALSEQDYERLLAVGRMADAASGVPTATGMANVITAARTGQTIAEQS